ncbi:disease resistance TIR-NBS-LRR class family protein [Tanacetum coccineum]
MPEHTAYPVFYDVEPTEVRKQSGAVGEAFAKHGNEEALGKWREALKEAARLAGLELKNTLDGHQARFIKKVVLEISLELRSINFGFDEMLVGMETRVKDVVSSLEVGIDEVRMIGIKGMGGAGKTTTTRAVFDHLSNDFEAKSFVENVREVSNGSMFGLKKLQEQVLSDVLNERVTVNCVNDGKNMMKRRMCGKKVLLVLDDVNHIDQLEALASGPNWFKPGSRIIVTTRDEQVLVAHKVNLIRDIDLLSDEEAICLLNRYAFGREIPSQGYEELSRKVVRHAAGLPLTIKVFGSFLCGKDKLEWVDAIDRLKRIPLKETLEKLELSFIGLEDDYKEIFLDIACILKGESKNDAIRILESCGFHARNGLKVLEQRSLITISKDEVLGMHDHIEEMGKNIVRREHPDEPNKYSHLWIDEEIEDILVNDMGTQATRCLKLNKSRGNARTVMKGLGKMKKLRYLEVNFAYYDFVSDGECWPKCRKPWLPKIKKKGGGECLDDTSEYFSNSLKYLKCSDYPFLYLPKTFQANNLVELDMKYSRMVQRWEDGQKKVLKKLRLISLGHSNLTTFDFRITPNLETLSLNYSFNLKEFYMPCQNLNYLEISHSRLRTFDLGLTPNLETFYLYSCNDFVELFMPVSCQKLKYLCISLSKLKTFDLGLTPNLERLSLYNCADFEELHVSLACPNLKFLDLHKLRLRNLDLELITNLERLSLVDCDREPKVTCSSATLYLVGESLDLGPLHPNGSIVLLKFRFLCYYNKYRSSSVGNIEKLISIGLCACTDLKKFSDMICSLQCLQKLTLKCNIPEFPKDLGQLESLESLALWATKIKHIPDSICMLKSLKSLTVYDRDLLEKLPEDIGQLECLETLHVTSKKIEYLPDSICMLKRLKWLNVEACRHLGKLPEDIGQLKFLEILDLLECLEELNIVDSGISDLPQSIFGLKGLRIHASPELLQMYIFPSEIKTRTWT